MGFVFHNGYRFGPFVLNLDRLCLQRGETDLDLRPKAFDVLRQLVSQAGRVVSKDELVAAVWPNVIVNDDALAQCVRDIRKALGDESETYIRTVPKRGYMFVADVEPLAAIGTKPPARPARMRPSLVVRGTTAAALLLLIVLVGSWSIGWRTAPEAEADTRLTIAVLPFTSGAGEEWLGDGIAEDIMTAMSRFRDLSVIARNSSFRFGGADADPKTIGQELGAHFLLQGSVRSNDDRLRVTAQLVDTGTGAIRWSDRYDRDFAEVFAVQDEIAEAVASQLVAHAREAATAAADRQRPESLAAYQLVLRARKGYASGTPAGADEARDLAARAIALEPSYADAWTVLARILVQYYIHPHDPSHATPEMLAAAREAARKAVELDPAYSGAHAILGFALLWSRQHDESLASFEQAMTLNPSDAAAVNLQAMALSYAGRYDEALRGWEVSARLDPFRYPILLAMNAMAHAMSGDFERALPLARNCAERAPGMQPCFIWLAIAANETGHEAEARKAVERLLEINPRFGSAPILRIFPFADEKEAERFVDLLARAGVPIRYEG
jgi:TolB-like protein/DNA-binding winged helix-turn-helix (wHTH) protein/Tfp pilus assembly protein PilF